MINAADFIGVTIRVFEDGEDEHPRYSASKISRIIPCPGSVALSDGVVDESSEYADEGTAAHTLAATVLLGATEIAEPEGRAVRREFVVDEDMAEHVQAYVDAVRRQPGELLVEQKVWYSDVIGVEKQGGTGDAIVIDLDQAQITVNDLKFGRGVKVYASHQDDDGNVVPNEQLAGYAIGALMEYSAYGDFETVKLAIHQPRINHYDEHTVTVAELRAFAQSFKAAVAEAEQGIALLKSGGNIEHLLKPTEGGCRWCPAADRCPALMNQVRSNAFDDYDNLEVKQVDDVPLTDVPSHRELELYEIFVKAWRSRIQRELQAGKKVPGWKLVKGKKGARQFIADKLEQVQKLLRKFKVKKADMFTEPKLKTPTQIEKLLTKDQYAELALAGVISQSDGGEHVVPESDPAPAIEKTNVAELLGDDSDLL